MAIVGIRSYADQVHRVCRLGDGFSNVDATGPDNSPAEVDKKEAAFTETVNQIFKACANLQLTLHPTKANPGEELPPGYSRSYAGFLIHNLEREIEVDQDVIKQKMDYLTQFMAIVCFVGDAPLKPYYPNGSLTSNEICVVLSSLDAH